MKYIAYGSNMSQEQMAFRCPNARLIGTGYLPNHQLEFYLHATVERKREASPGVPVAVWEIDAEDEKRLDRYEGFPTYYIKHQATVHMDDGSRIKGMLYLMNTFHGNLPAQSYYNGIRDAYEALGLGSEINRVLMRALVRAKYREEYGDR